MQDATHDSSLKSFLPVESDSDFPIQNLPFGVASGAKNPEKRVVTRVGQQVIDLAALEKAGLLKLDAQNVFNQPQLNRFMSLGHEVWKKARRQISELLRMDSGALKDNITLQNEAVLPVKDVQMHIPAQIGDYTDFYSSREHASNVGAMFRDKENPLLPNWLHLPVGYHGRASSVVIDGQDIVRPLGQIKGPDDEVPRFAPCQRLDFELEMACFIGTGNKMGEAIQIGSAQEHVFGVVLMNDWSARDIQKWEYVPLGPFTAKNFATSISPWVVTLDALEPFKTASVKPEKPLLPYLQHPNNELFSYDIELFVDMQAAGESDWHQICHSNSKFLYWTMAQQVAHHTVTGCNLQSGDLLATGTISGKDTDSFGSLLELSWGGKQKIKLGSQERTFIQDGDGIRMRGWCQGDGYRVGFGQVASKVLPSSSH